MLTVPQPYFWILPLTASVHFVVAERISGVVPTRQNSSSGRPKSPRIQVVLPEDLCDRLSALADTESRTVSNMAKVLIQQGVERLERQQAEGEERTAGGSDRFRQVLEQQQRDAPRRLRGAPRRLRLRRPAG
jgi:predicted DNA-binding protein